MITNQELIATLIVKTGLDEQTVKGQLHAWQKDVLAKLDRGEDVLIHGVGVLKQTGGSPSQEKPIEFNPDSQLAHEVNFKYVGLAEVVQQMPEDPSKDRADEKDPDRSGGKGQPSTITPVSPKSDATSTSESQYAPHSTGDAKKESVTPSKSSGQEHATKPGQRSSTQSSQKSQAFEQGSPLRWVAAIVVLAVAFTVLLWQLPIERPAASDALVESPDQQETPDVASTENDESQGASQDMSQDESQDTEQGSNQSTPEESSTIQESQDTPYGLTGSYNPNIEDSFTIVLYSLSNVQNALTQRDQLQAQSYRAFARERTLNSGTVTTQVCVGQFERFEDAVNAANASFGEAGINFFISAHSQSILE